MNYGRHATSRFSRFRQDTGPSIDYDRAGFTTRRSVLSKGAADDRLGPIFESRLDGEWGVHLEKMKAFWRSVLLKTGEYKGKPVPAHTRLTEVASQDFHIWLAMFERTVEDVFAETAQPIVVDAARRIASSLWLAMNPDPFAKPPDWSAPHDAGHAWQQTENGTAI